MQKSVKPNEKTSASAEVFFWPKFSKSFIYVEFV